MNFDENRNRLGLSARMAAFALAITLGIAVPTVTLHAAEEESGEEAKPAATAFAWTGLKLSARTIQQVESAANCPSRGDLTQRRPAGLGPLDSDAAIELAIATAIGEITPDGSEREKLRYLGSRAVRRLIRGLKDKDPVVREKCALALEGRGSVAVAPLSNVIRTDLEPSVRFAAAEALGTTYDPKAIPALVEALRDKDHLVLEGALRALQYVKSKEAFGPVKTVLENTRIGQDLPVLAATTLVWIDREAGIKAVQAVLAKEPDTNYLHRNLNVSMEIGRYPIAIAYWPPELLEVHQLVCDAKTLAGERFGKREISKLLAQIDSPEWGVASVCVSALGSLRADSAVPAIIASARKRSRKVPASCAFSALAAIASPEAVKYLLEVLQSDDQNMRVAALTGLQVAGGRWAVPVLVELLNDPHLRMRGFQDDLEQLGLPDEHLAREALYYCLGRAGLQGAPVNLETDAKFSVDEDIGRIKAWWKDNGEDFLRGKAVPNPRISTAW